MITTTKPNQLEELEAYHEELHHNKRAQLRDNFVLLTLAIAGLFGVYALLITGIDNQQITEGAPPKVEGSQKVIHPKKTTISALQ